MSAFTGRDVTLEFAIADETASLGGLTFKTLGMCRAKSMKVAWDVADVTADKSPQYTKQSLVTFKAVEFSGDGVTYTDALHNQAELKAHVYNPGAGTGNQPKCWLRLTDASGVIVGPFILSEWSSDAPYDDAVTWSISAQSNGAVTFTAT